MSSNLRVEIATEADLPSLAAVIVRAFSHTPIEAIMTGSPDDPATFRAAEDRYLQACRQHARHFSTPYAVKCLHTDPQTGKETFIGGAFWFIYDRPRSEEEYEQPISMLTGEWVADPVQRTTVQAFMQPVFDARMRIMRGRSYALLMYMAVDPDWRRRGSSTMCVRWGLDHCDKLGIPAYLEASDEGAPVYRRLGFEMIETLQLDVPGFLAVDCPIMVYWPQGTTEEDKKISCALE